MSVELKGKVQTKDFNGNVIEEKMILCTRPDGEPAYITKDRITVFTAEVEAGGKGFKLGYNEEDSLADRIRTREINNARFEAQKRVNEKKHAEMVKAAKEEAKRIVAEEFPELKPKGRPASN